MAWNLPLALFAICGFLALAITAIRRNEIAVTDIFVGAGLFLFSIIASWLAVGALFFLGSCWSAFREARGGPPIPWLRHDVSIMTGCALLSTAVRLRGNPLVCWIHAPARGAWC